MKQVEEPLHWMGDQEAQSREDWQSQYHSPQEPAYEKLRMLLLPEAQTLCQKLLHQEEDQSQRSTDDQSD